MTYRGFLCTFVFGCGGEEIVDLLTVDLEEADLHMDLHLQVKWKIYS